MRSPTTWKPPFWIMARISPACPAATASGLMMEKVRCTLIIGLSALVETHKYGGDNAGLRRLPTGAQNTILPHKTHRESQKFPQRLSQPALNLLSDIGRRRAHRDACLFHGLNLVRGFTRPARDDRASVSPAPSGRRRLPGHESHHRFFHVRLDVCRGGLLGVATDLADHHDGVRVRVRVEQLQRIQESGSDNRIAANPDAGGLSDA